MNYWQDSNIKTMFNVRDNAIGAGEYATAALVSGIILDVDSLHTSIFAQKEAMEILYGCFLQAGTQSFDIYVDEANIREVIKTANMFSIPIKIVEPIVDKLNLKLEVKENISNKFRMGAEGRLAVTSSSSWFKFMDVVTLIYNFAQRGKLDLETRDISILQGFLKGDNYHQSRLARLDEIIEEISLESIKKKELLWNTIADKYYCLTNTASFLEDLEKDMYGNLFQADFIVFCNKDGYDFIDTKKDLNKKLKLVNLVDGWRPRFEVLN